MHCSPEGVLVQKVRCEKIVEVGGVMRGVVLGVFTVCTVRDSVLFTDVFTVVCSGG